MKKCLKCGQEFDPRRGNQKYCQRKCRLDSPARREVNKEYQIKRREAINRIKTDSGCVVCGYNSHPAALDFNHVRGEKRFGIGANVKRSWQDTLDEIEKCDVLCANCHRVHTYENRHWQTKRKDYALL